MEIKVKLNFKEYLKLQYVLTYTNYVTLISTFIVLVAFIVSIGQLLDGETDDTFWVVFLGVYVIVRPILIYFAAKRNFNTHQTLQDEMIYEFFPDKFILTTPFSKTELPWSKIYKIRELKGWFLLYQSNRIANLIPKSTLSDLQISSLRDIARNSGIKTQLKAN